MNLSVITQRGWGWAVGALLSLIVGLIGGWSEFIGLGIAGLFTFGLALLYALFRHAHQVRFSLVHHRVVVGEDAQISLTVTNPTNRSLPPLEIDIPVGEEVTTRDISRLKKGETQEIFLPIPTTHRGIVPVGPAKVLRQDPLGLVSREVSHGTASQLFIHPRTIALMSLSTGFVRDLEGNPTRDLTDSDLSFHALREYIPGDDRRNIHWKSTAKTGLLMVRQFEQTRRSHLMIAVDTNQTVYATDDEFELAVSVAASLGVRAIGDTRELSVVVDSQAKTPQGGALSILREKARDLAALGRQRGQVARKKIRKLSTVSSQRLLDELSGVTAETDAVEVIELARLAAVDAADVSVVFLVTGAAHETKTLHAASVAFPVGVEVVVLTCAPEASPSIKKLDSLTIATIGRLDDVQQLLSRRSVNT